MDRTVSVPAPDRGGVGPLWSDTFDLQLGRTPDGFTLPPLLPKQRWLKLRWEMKERASTKTAVRKTFPQNTLFPPPLPPPLCLQSGPSTGLGTSFSREPGLWGSKGSPTLGLYVFFPKAVMPCLSKAVKSKLFSFCKESLYTFFKSRSYNLAK